MDNKRIKLATRHFQRLLQLYPESYRTQFGDEMTQVFRDMYRSRLNAHENTWELWLQTYIDIGVSAMVQSVSSKSSGRDSISQTVSLLGRMTNWLITFAFWVGLAAAFDVFIAKSLYSHIPLDALGIGSGTEFTQQSFLYLANAAISAVLLPLLWASRKHIVEKLSLISASLLALAALPPFIRSYHAFDQTAAIVYQEAIARDVIAIVLLGFIVKAIIALRTQTFRWQHVYMLARTYAIPAIIVGVALVLEHALGNNQTTIARTFAHSEASLVLGISIMTFVLLLSRIAWRPALYFIFSLFVVFSTLNFFAIHAFHDAVCAGESTGLQTLYYYHDKIRNADADIMSTRDYIHRQCDPSYDVQPLSTPNKQ